MILAALLFSYAGSIPLPFRVHGDASDYMIIADRFLSLGDAFNYVGNRTYGYPLFLYIINAMGVPDGREEWVSQISYCQFVIHLCACMAFYTAFLKDLFQRSKLPDVVAPFVAAALMAFPSLVTYTTVPLTDTFCADILMMAAAVHSMGHRYAGGQATFILSVACGVLLGYAVLVRPSLGLGVIAFYGVEFYGLFLNRKKWRSPAVKSLLMVMATLTLILPAMWNVWEMQGTVGLQNKDFVQVSVHDSMQRGLSAVRVYWPAGDATQDPLPGVRDPYLDAVYGEECTVDSVFSLATCLLSQPHALPAYFVKKSIAIFDVPHIQPYALELTPDWFVPLERVFGTVSFCGLISVLVMICSRSSGRQKSPWIGGEWVALVLALTLLHSLLHIEGRYSFPLVPFLLPSLFLGFSAARKAGRRFYMGWLLSIFVAGMCFVYQVSIWDTLPPTR